MDNPDIRATTEDDMSPEAIDQRLRNVSQLYKLGMAIREARTNDLGAVEDVRHGESNRSGKAQVD